MGTLDKILQAAQKISAIASIAVPGFGGLKAIDLGIMLVKKMVQNHNEQSPTEPIELPPDNELIEMMRKTFQDGLDKNKAWFAEEL